MISIALWLAGRRQRLYNNIQSLPECTQRVLILCTWMDKRTRERIKVLVVSKMLQFPQTRHVCLLFPCILGSTVPWLPVSNAKITLHSCKCDTILLSYREELSIFSCVIKKSIGAICVHLTKRWLTLGRVSNVSRMPVLQSLTGGTRTSFFYVCEFLALNRIISSQHLHFILETSSFTYFTRSSRTATYNEKKKVKERMKSLARKSSKYKARKVA